MIVAVSRNGAVGRAGHLPWDYPEDRDHYAATIRGHAVIMGRRTFEERGAVPDCTNIVVSQTFVPPPEIHRATNLDDALAIARGRSNGAPFVIGGRRLFEEAAPRATTIYLTEIPESPEADTFFTLDRSGLTVLRERTTLSGLRFLVLVRS